MLHKHTTPAALRKFARNLIFTCRTANIVKESSRNVCEAANQTSNKLFSDEADAKLIMRTELEQETFSHSQDLLASSSRRTEHRQMVFGEIKQTKQRETNNERFRVAHIGSMPN